MVAPRSSRPVPVRDVLRLAVPELGARMLEATIRREWTRTVGQELARRSQPGELRAGTLTVIVDNSPWLQELTLRSGELLQAVRARHGDAVTALRLSLGALAPAAEPATRRRSEPSVELSDEEVRTVEDTAAPLPDPGLRASLRRLLTKDVMARRRRESNRRRDHAAATDREDP